jgi:hypothetical protein
MLAIKVSATPESVDIQGLIPLELANPQSSGEPPYLLTTERTS